MWPSANCSPQEGLRRRCGSFLHAARPSRQCAFTLRVFAAGRCGGSLRWVVAVCCARRCKKLGSNWLDTRQKMASAEIESKASLEMGRITHEYRQLQLEHQVRFTKLHELRAETIAEVYRLLAKARRHMAVMTAVFEPVGIASKEERAQVAFESMVAFHAYYDEHKIFIPDATCLQIEAIFHALRQADASFTVYVLYAEKMGRPLDREALDHWTSSNELVTGDVEKSMELLIDDFRTLLGDRATEITQQDAGEN